MKHHRPQAIRRAPRPLVQAITAALAAAFASHASAAVTTWDGSATHSNWKTALNPGTGTFSSNWKSPDGKSVSVSSGDALVFAGTRRLNNNNDERGLSLSSISFADGAGAFSLGGNIITLSGVGGTTISNSSKALQTFNMGVMLGSASLWQGGSAGLAFNGQVNVGDADLKLAGGVTINNAGLKIPGTNIFQNFEVGVNSSGKLGIDSGSVVRTNLGLLGYNSGSNGSVSVTGAGSQWNASGLYVGMAGTGTLTVQNSAVVSAGDMTLADAAGGSANVTVSGAGSQLNTGQFRVGINAGGTGVVSILDAGLVTAQQMAIGAKSRLILDGGTLQLSGGSIATGGAFDWRKGTLSYTGDTLVGGGLLGSSPAVGMGQTLKVAGALSTSNGTLRIDNGGVVSSGAGYLGSTLAGQGHVTVSGLGSQWSSGSELHIGHAGSATLNIENGAQVSGAWVALGWDQGSQGSVNLSGAGSQLLSTGDINVGWDGSGVMNINSGAVLVSNAAGVIGSRAGASGAVEVSGAGSRWSQAATLSVGDSGTGTLNIKNGATVSSYVGYVGIQPGSMGKVTVSGAGSQWNNSNSLYISRSGEGRLNIENGGVVNTGFVTVGRASGTGQASGTGSINVTGAGSRLNVAHELSLGGFGPGELNLQDGGSARLESLTIAQRGAVHLGEGSQLITVNGTNNIADLTFNGNSSIQGKFTNAGRVAASAGTTGTLSFLDAVRGPGSYAGNILFKAAFNPGNDPSAISFNGGNASFDVNSVLTMEFYGGTPRGWYDQLLNIHTLTFKGSLNLVFGDGYTPTPGTRFSLLDFDAFAGALTAEQITVTGFDKRQLDFSRLAIDGSLSVSAVPEPHSWALMLAGSLMLGGVARRRRLTSTAFVNGGVAPVNHTQFGADPTP